MTHRPLLLACCPLLVAAAAACVPGSPHAVGEARVRSPLGANAYAQRLPPVRGGRALSVPFRVVNRGDEPLTLTDVQPDCGCLAPIVNGRRWDSRTPLTLAAGQSADLRLRADTAREPVGPQDHAVTLKAVTASGRAVLEVLTAEYEVLPHELAITPPAIAVYQSPGAATERTVRLIDRRPDGFTVTGIDTPGPHVVAGPPRVTPVDGGGREIAIDLTVRGHTPDGRLEHVVVRTDDPYYRAVPIPVAARPFTLGQSLGKKLAGPKATLPKASGPKVR